MAMQREDLVQLQRARDALNDVTNSDTTMGGANRQIDASKVKTRFPTPCNSNRGLQQLLARSRAPIQSDSSPSRGAVDVAGSSLKIVEVEEKVYLEMPEDIFDEQKEVEAKRAWKPTLFVRMKDLVFLPRNCRHLYLRTDAVYNALLESMNLPCPLESHKPTEDPEAYNRHAIFVLVEEVLPPQHENVRPKMVYFSELGMFAFSRKAGKLESLLSESQGVSVFRLHHLPETRPTRLLAEPVPEPPGITSGGLNDVQPDPLHEHCISAPVNTEYQLIGNKMRRRLPDVPEDF
ncbi:hypothetical protein V5O48_014157 [Marasmius crinis-equi]|uniref:Uncharacterized protein n=1 Tax=Marasmius crinis-equi TaxID=585013 RepID=A0ABR3EY32_9AGAR